MSLRGIVVLLFALCSAVFPLLSAWADVGITTANFPDANFRAYVAENLDTDGDGTLSDAEIAEAKVIAVDGKGIESLEGIRHFSALRYLYCDSNALAALDVSGCGELRILTCRSNVLTTLNVTGCDKLVGLYCRNNLLTEIDVNDHTALRSLFCHNNLIEVLDVYGCTALENLWCQSNKIGALNLTKCVNLEELRCSGNLLKSLDLSQCVKLSSCVLDQAVPGMANAVASGNSDYPYQIDLGDYAPISGIAASSVQGYLNDTALDTQYDAATGIARFKFEPTGVKYNYDTGFAGADLITPLYMGVTLTNGIVINTMELPDGYLENYYRFDLTVNGTMTGSLKWSAEPLPGGLRLLSYSGRIYGTPTVEGTYSVVLTATAGTQTATKTLPLIIKPASEAPTRPTITTTTSSLPTATKGTAYNATLAATGTAPITWSLASGTLPSGLTLSEAGVISGTPDTVGRYAFGVAASNEVSARTRYLVINVALSDSVVAPEITTTTADLPSGTVGGPYSAILDATGTTPITWEWVSGTLPDGLKLSETGIISGTPTRATSSSFSVRAANEAGNDRKTLRIAVYTSGGNNGGNNGGSGNSGSGGGGGGCDAAGLGVLSLLAVAIFLRRYA